MAENADTGIREAALKGVDCTVCPWSVRGRPTGCIVARVAVCLPVGRSLKKGCAWRKALRASHLANSQITQGTQTASSASCSQAHLRGERPAQHPSPNGGPGQTRPGPFSTGQPAQLVARSPRIFQILFHSRSTFHSRIVSEETPGKLLANSPNG